MPSRAPRSADINAMMSDGNIVKADFELIVWIVVVVATLISQIVKAGRQRPGRQPGPTRPPRLPRPPPTEAQRELEDFLASLTGQRPTRREPAPPAEAPPPPAAPAPHRRPPAPTPAPVVVRRKPTARSQQPEVQAPAPERARPMAVEYGKVQLAPERLPAPKPFGLAAAIRETIAGADPYGSRRKTSSSSRKLAKAIGADLVSRDGLRKAMVLREILDRPLSLRQLPGRTMPGMP